MPELKSMSYLKVYLVRYCMQHTLIFLAAILNFTQWQNVRIFWRDVEAHFSINDPNGQPSFTPVWWNG